MATNDTPPQEALMQARIDKVLRAIEAWDEDTSIDEDIKTRLHAQIQDFIEDTESQLKVRLNFADEIPEQLEYIVTSVATRRFNIKGKEGFSSYSQEGESMSIVVTLMDEFQPDIDRWNTLQMGKGSANRSAARFI